MGSSLSPSYYNLDPSSPVGSSYTHSHHKNNSLAPLTKKCLGPNIRLCFRTASIQTTIIHHKKWVTSTITMLNITYIKSLLPITFLTKVEGEPTHNNTREVHLKLQINVGSVHSDLGVGGNGLLGLVMRPALYLILTKSEFNLPQHPVNCQWSHMETQKKLQANLCDSTRCTRINLV